MTYDVDVGDVTRDILLDFDCDLSEVITSGVIGTLDVVDDLPVAGDIIVALTFRVGFSILRKPFRRENQPSSPIEMSTLALNFSTMARAWSSPRATRAAGATAAAKAIAPEARTKKTVEKRIMIARLGESRELKSWR